jgi:hypothetical protein
MSERELQRVEILTAIIAGRLTVTSAADILGLERRQVQRLLKAYRQDGAAGLAHKARGRRSNRAFADDLRHRVLTLVQQDYGDFGPTFLSEVLAERHSLTVSRETLRLWMTEAGLWRSRSQRRALHQPRLRREHFGELVQIDGSEHRWFEDRGPPCSLLVFIDDATGRLMQLRFVKSESAFSYFEALRGYLTAHGRPLAFYSDKHSVFRVSKTEAKGGQGMTQFGRALSELGIEILCANSSQAKGRVERVNRTLQDRLVKELRLAGVATIEAGNAFLPDFMERFNARFAAPPARPQDLHRPLGLADQRLSDVLAWREQRYVGRDLALSYQRKRIILDDNDFVRSATGRYVDTYEYPDGRFDVRWKGVSLSYRVFDKDQRVTHSAIVENKRLSEVLAWVKARQDEMRPQKPKTNSEVIQYEKRPPGRRGRISFVDRHIADEQAKITAPTETNGATLTSAEAPPAPTRRRIQRFDFVRSRKEKSKRIAAEAD